MIDGLNIEIENLSLNFGNDTILDNINMEIKSGEIHALIGPNGAGKSSLLKCILGYNEYEGKIILSYNKNKKIGYVPQKLDFEKSLPITVEDFLTLSMKKRAAFFKISKKNSKYFDEILSEVGLLDKKKSLIGNLSGGELQRLLLAQAINPRPNLLILDEPFSAIDTIFEKYLIELMLNLKKEGITILWVNHNIAQVKNIADKVSCIKRKVFFTGKPKEVLTDDKIISIYT